MMPRQQTSCSSGASVVTLDITSKQNSTTAATSSAGANDESPPPAGVSAGPSQAAKRSAVMQASAVVGVTVIVAVAVDVSDLPDGAESSIAILGRLGARKQKSWHANAQRSETRLVLAYMLSILYLGRLTEVVAKSKFAIA